jgi:Cu(I)/Ag(I) efflux system protein CusF
MKKIMKSLKQLICLAALGAGWALPVTGHAQTPAAGTSKTSPTDMTDAEVRRVDKANSKITLKHGAIKNLDMPAMTMVFQVTDAVMLDKVKAGDKVRFAAINDGGKLTVTRIQPAQ